MTHAQAEAALSHAIKQVLGHPEDGPLVMALAHAAISDICDLITLSDVDNEAATRNRAAVFDIVRSHMEEEHFAVRQRLEMIEQTKLEEELY